ncbi:hypothetical protein [Oceanirhabdus sp. W0125-5]|uniref:hypothetical protein n=1 Tax=Oceanirhabdus sp. W0125-5 TaxID=2999116 RepID=UPI0022F2B17C|nr:hypothetical protein [Oceanirhabdus sp. W0125-5]WBW95259.1 hypothetical protein OW730_16375 [Oceanirhabdus sp. W0125-5]
MYYPTENEVINAVVSKLKSFHFKVLSTCNTKERGIDIISEKDNYKLLIEAKGGTSSKENTKKYGVPFDRNQAKTHISVAILKTMELITKYKDQPEYIFGIALPYEKNHLEFIERVKYTLNELGIVIFWVKREEVTIENSNLIEGIMNEMIDEAQILQEFKCFLRKKDLKETSVKDDISRINMMKKRNIIYSKGEDYARELLYNSGLSRSTIVSCLRVCRYYKEYLEQKVK